MSRVYLGKAGTQYNAGGAPYRDVIKATKMATQLGGKVKQIGQDQYMIDMTDAEKDVPREMYGRISKEYSSDEALKYYGVGAVLKGLSDRTPAPAQAPSPPTHQPFSIQRKVVSRKGTPYAEAAPPTIRKQHAGSYFVESPTDGRIMIEDRKKLGRSGEKEKVSVWDRWRVSQAEDIYGNRTDFFPSKKEAELYALNLYEQLNPVQQQVLKPKPKFEAVPKVDLDPIRLSSTSTQNYTGRNVPTEPDLYSAWKTLESVKRVPTETIGQVNNPNLITKEQRVSMLEGDESFEEFERRKLIKAHAMAEGSTLQEIKAAKFDPDVTRFDRAVATKAQSIFIDKEREGTRAASEAGRQASEDAKIERMARKQDLKDSSLIEHWEAGKEKRDLLAQEVRAVGLEDYKAYKESKKPKVEKVRDKFGRVMDTEVAEEFAYREEAKRAAKELEELAKAADKAAREQERQEGESKKNFESFAKGLMKVGTVVVGTLAAVGYAAAENAEREIFGAAGAGMSRGKYAGLINQIGLGTDRGGKLADTVGQSIINTLRNPDSLGSEIEAMATATALSGGKHIDYAKYIQAKMSGDHDSVMNIIDNARKDMTPLQFAAAFPEYTDLTASRNKEGFTGKVSERTGTDSKIMYGLMDASLAAANALGGDFPEAVELGYEAVTGLGEAAGEAATLVSDFNDAFRVYNTNVKLEAQGFDVEDKHKYGDVKGDTPIAGLEDPSILGAIFSNLWDGIFGEDKKPSNKVNPLATSTGEVYAIGSFLDKSHFQDPRSAELYNLMGKAQRDPTTDIGSALRNLKLEVAFETIKLEGGGTEVRPYLREYKVNSGSIK